MLLRRLFLVITLLLGKMNSCLSVQNKPQKMVVSIPIANMRLAPGYVEESQAPLLFNGDPLQSSQLLYNEHVIALQEEGDWLKVLALEQSPPLRNGYREGLIGWVRKECAVAVDTFPQYNLTTKCPWANVYNGPDRAHKILFKISLGTKWVGKRFNTEWWLVDLVDGTKGYVHDDTLFFVSKKLQDEQMLRHSVVKGARQLLATPYCWGGRTAFNALENSIRTGVDCSSLVELAYRSCGLQLSRLSHFQYLHSQQISPQSMLPGDLIFFAKLENPQLVVHVMLYLGDDILIEATGWEIDYPFLSQVISIKDKIGKPLALLKQGEVSGRYIVYFGSYLADKSLTQKVRDTFLHNEYKEYFSLSDGYRCFFRPYDQYYTLLARNSLFSHKDPFLF